MPNERFVGGQQPQGEGASGGAVVDPSFPQVRAWTCPACGEEQVGPVRQCPSCGAGAPPVHVGKDKPTPKRATAPVMAAHTPTPSSVPVYQIFRGQHLFLAWYKSLTDAQVPTLEDAFYAGYLAALQETKREMLTTALDIPLSYTETVPAGPVRVRTGQPPAAPPLPAVQYDPEGRTARTLIAALSHYLEHVLPELVEEVAAGELLTVEEAEALLATLKAEHPYA